MPEASRKFRKALKRELRNEIKALHMIGGQMANLCFNLAQDPKIDANIRVTMDELCRTWDSIPVAERRDNA